jgi:hypothetical protein
MVISHPAWLRAVGRLQPAAISGPARAAVAAFRFKGPHGIPGPVFLAVVALIIAAIVVAALRHRRLKARGDDRRHGPTQAQREDHAPWQ